MHPKLLSGWSADVGNLIILLRCVADINENALNVFPLNPNAATTSCRGRVGLA